ncbi:nineteen complex-related protein 2-domain-containing protein [Tuber brumale]|nr:nineteen complex-related protein 2-domain-containing protein [Tuber brumale]
MHSTLASRRPKARVVARDDESEEEEEQTKVVKAPPKSTEQSQGNLSRPKRKKKRSSLRLSFGPDASTVDDEEREVFALKKSTLSRKAIEKNAARKSGLSAGVIGMEHLNLIHSIDRPTYSKEHLEELRSNTPTIPLSQQADLEVEDVDMDVVGADVLEANENTTLTKYGESSKQGTIIPDEGLVRVMKARRAEKAAKAKAEDYISLNIGSDDGSGEILLKSKKKESRIQRAEDNMYDEEELVKYVEDGGIVLGSKAAQRAHDRKRREDIRDAIKEAEGIHDDAMDMDSDSRDSLVEEWERDQIRKGDFSNPSGGGIARDLEMLSRQPPDVTPLPNLDDALRRLEETLAAMEFKKAQTVRQMEALQTEKQEISEREVMVQQRLQKASEEYEKLRKGLGIGGSGGGASVIGRGLESFGNTPIMVDEET